MTDPQDVCPTTPRGDKVDAQGCSCDVTVQLLFANDSAELTAEDKVTLDRLAATLQQMRFSGGEAAGHTDNRGSDAYNNALSKRRAQAVVDYVATKGVSIGGVNVVGLGESQPVADNATAEGRALNRRVVLRRTDCAAGR